MVLTEECFCYVRRPRLEQEGGEAVELDKALEMGLLLVQVLYRLLLGELWPFQWAGWKNPYCMESQWTDGKSSPQQHVQEKTFHEAVGPGTCQ